jgi:hypothetical protein
MQRSGAGMAEGPVENILFSCKQETVEHGNKLIEDQDDCIRNKLSNYCVIISSKLII